MSKGGGAGKVYFILYLAVLLELLIIIVERDDAEEAFRKEREALLLKTKRIQLIAETIINSLRGSPTAVSSTSDQSMVLGDKNEAQGRDFNVRIRLADPTHDTVKDLQLHILRNNVDLQQINLAADSILYPRSRDSNSKNDIIFKYNFKPQFGAGEYKLHFDAKTNQIVGVTQSASPDDTVKIGAVHLTVKELKEVKDNIQENISLRGYIDSLLNGGYENFAANIGSNEFTVNVKPPQEVDQLKIFPQESDFASFPTMDLPNPVKIEGATIGGPQGVKITRVDGPGEIIPAPPPDSGYYWSWKPGPTDVGQTYTVKLSGKANRNGAQKDQAATQFNVSVKPVEYAAPQVFFPLVRKKPAALTGIPFRYNGQIKGLDGVYHVELLLNGVKVKESDEPVIEFTPEFLKDEGKKLEVRESFKSSYMKGNTFLPLRDTEFVISAPPLAAAADNDPVTVGDDLILKAGLGIAGQTYLEVPSDQLTVESDGYFEATASKMHDGKAPYYYYKVKMKTTKAGTIKDKNNGKPLTLTITDPKTGLSTTVDMTIMPKVQQKGAGSRNKM